MSLRKAPQTVHEAARMLDGMMPGWYQKIDIDRLNMGIAEDCILGQLYGNYEIGIKKFDRSHLSSTADQAFSSRASYDEWVEAILKRREEPVKKSEDDSIDLVAIHTLFQKLQKRGIVASITADNISITLNK